MARSLNSEIGQEPNNYLDIGIFDFPEIHTPWHSILSVDLEYTDCIFCRRVRPPQKSVLGMTLNCIQWFWSLGKSGVIPSLLLLSDSLWPREVVPVEVPSMGQINAWKLLVLDRNTWNHITIWY